MYNHIKEIVADSEKTGKPISELIIEQECQMSGLPREKVWNKMKYNLETMRDAVKKGRSGNGCHLCYANSGFIRHLAWCLVFIRKTTQLN